MIPGEVYRYVGPAKGPYGKAILDAGIEEGSHCRFVGVHPLVPGLARIKGPSGEAVTDTANLLPAHVPEVDIWLDTVRETAKGTEDLPDWQIERIQTEWPDVWAALQKADPKKPPGNADCAVYLLQRIGLSVEALGQNRSAPFLIIGQMQGFALRTEFDSLETLLNWAADLVHYWRTR